MSIKLDTWRKQLINAVAATKLRVDLEPLKVDEKTVRPNVLQVKNVNTSDILYVKENDNISSSDYLLSIDPQTTGKSLLPEGINYIYLLIASNTNRIEVSSAYDPEPSTTDIDGTQAITIINQSLTVSNVGITSIAAGDNTIGRVKITDGSDVLAVNADGSINIQLAAGTNNIGDVDILTLPSLAAGTNYIGKVRLTDGTDDAIVNADGSIDVNIAGGTVNVTASNISVVDSGSHEWNINADGSGDVNILNSIPSGDNNIGNVDVVTLPSLPAGSNNIGKVTLDNADAGEIVKPATTPVIYNVTCVSAATEYSQALPSNCKGFTIGIQSKDDTVEWQLKFGAAGTEFRFNGTESFSIDNLYLASQTLYFESDTAGEIIQIIAWS